MGPAIAFLLGDLIADGWVVWQLGKSQWVRYGEIEDALAQISGIYANIEQNENQ